MNNFFRTCVFLICSLAAAVPARAQVNAEQVMNIGRNVLGMEDYMLAIQYFNQAIKAKPYLSDPYFLRGLAKLQLDDYRGAVDDCTLAIERNRFKTEAYKVRGFARQQLGLDSLAILDYDRGLEYNPVDQYFLFYKSVAQTELERFEAADSTFATLLRQYPRFEEGFSARGRLNLLRGDTVAALADIDRALTLSKSLINPYIMRAEVHSKRAEWADALADMDQAVRLASDQPDLYINRAFLRYSNNDYFGAMSDYNYAIELAPSNYAALFNRALLLFEVSDLENAARDFSAVLKLNPKSFHALYNRGLIYLQQGQFSKAQKDFQAIADRYPRFYPVYYALAESRRGQGDLRGAFSFMNKADDLVRRYVDNPERNPLDRPTIAATSNQTSRRDNEEDMTDSEVMDRFNQLITSADAADTQLAYNEKIKGRVQDRNLQVQPEPMYSLTFETPAASLNALSNYFRELDNLNQRHYISQTFHLVAGSPSPIGEGRIADTFARVEAFTSDLSTDRPRPIDFLGRAVAYTMLKNYPAAIADFDRVIEATPDNTVAYMGRAYAHYMNSSRNSAPGTQQEESTPLPAPSTQLLAAMADYDKALQLNPNLVYAWFNKGNIYYEAGDFTSARQAYTQALQINPEFGQAYYNRGLCYLNSGNRQQGFEDLSKAGELGVLPSYNLLKRMK